jgi:hypothetical protein
MNNFNFLKQRMGYTYTKKLLVMYLEFSGPPELTNTLLQIQADIIYI